MRFLTLVVTLCFAFSAFAGVAILIGRQQPLPEHLAMLHLTDCAPPCWIGIVPSVTAQGDVKAIFEKAFPNHRPYFIVPGNMGGVQFQSQLTIETTPLPRDRVSQILIADLDSSGNYIAADSPLMPRLGDVLILWGFPTCMYVESGDYWRLHYKLGNDGLNTLDIIVKGHRFWPEQPIFYIFMYRTTLDYNHTICFRLGDSRWLGFVNER